MRSLALAAVLLPASALALHCGGPTPPVKAPTSGSASADAGAPPPVLISSALPSAKWPPPLQLTSKDVTGDGSARCNAAAATGKDAKSTVEALAKLCSGARRDSTGLAPQVATLDSTSAATTFDFQLKDCAVVVASADASVKSYVVVVEDSRGAPIAELPGDAISRSVASIVFCGAASKVTVRVAVGAGAGKVAVAAELLRRDAKP